MKRILEMFYKGRKARVFQFESPTLRSERIGLLVQEYEDENHAENTTGNIYRVSGMPGGGGV